MVFFICSVCGESLKLSQVEKHYLTKCRKCEMVSCVDCGKEFWGNDYAKHNKCISEEEKYSGKNYKPKPGANKGEQKQELWTQQVQQAISKIKGNQGLTNLLKRIADFPNIPRKKAKFQNFLKNSLRFHNTHLLDQAWDAISSEIELTAKKNIENANNNDKSNDDTNSTDHKTKSNNDNNNGDIVTTNNNNTNIADNDINNDDNKKLKEKNKKKKMKQEMETSKQEEEPPKQEVEPQEMETKKDKKSKKRKKEIEQDADVIKTTNNTNGDDDCEKENDVKNDCEAVPTKKLKKLSKDGSKKAVKLKSNVDGNKTSDNHNNNDNDMMDKGNSINITYNNHNDIDNNTDNSVINNTPNKIDLAFKWSSTMLKVLQEAPDHQLHIKKFRKKILKDYKAMHNNSSEDLSLEIKDKLLTKLDKKISKNSRIKLLGDVVSLV